jgi:hypothetical protein
MAAAMCAVLIGCEAGGPTYIPTERERLDMMRLMLPHAVKIQPFSQIASFDDDDIPDGILAVIRPVDRFGDPVKAAGLFYFELWTREQAAGERKGQPLAYWDLTIDSREEITQYWTRAQMYEFQLAWTQGAEAIRPGQKYILVATYRPPWDETIRDEYVLEFSLPRDAMGRAAR